MFLHLSLSNTAPNSKSFLASSHAKRYTKSVTTGVKSVATAFVGSAGRFERGDPPGMLPRLTGTHPAPVVTNALAATYLQPFVILKSEPAVASLPGVNTVVQATSVVCSL